MSSPQLLVEEESIGPSREVLDAAAELVAEGLIQRLCLERIREVNGLGASACRRLGLGRDHQPSRESLPAETGFNPQALQLAAVSPCPSTDASDDRAGFAHEDRELDLVSELHRGRRLATDARLEDFE